MDFWYLKYNGPRHRDLIAPSSSSRSENKNSLDRFAWTIMKFKLSKGEHVCVRLCLSNLENWNFSKYEQTWKMLSHKLLEHKRHFTFYCVGRTNACFAEWIVEWRVKRRPQKIANISIRAKQIEFAIRFWVGNLSAVSCRFEKHYNWPV